VKTAKLATPRSIKRPAGFIRPENDEIMRALIFGCRQDFLTFASECFELLTGRPLIPAWYVEAMAAGLTSIWNGKNDRLIINAPPGFLKSFLGSVAGPAFLLGRDPTKRVIVASSTLDLAADLSNPCRRILTSNFYKRAFPQTVISPTKNTELEVGTTAGGYRLATSMEGALGRRADILIIDDPIKPSDAESERMRDRCHQLFNSALVPRLNDQAHDPIVLLMQRLHHDDLSGRLLRKEPWPHLRLAAIAEADEEIRPGDGKVYRRKPSELLDPERLPKSRLDELRSSLGEEIFKAQFQQCPVGPEGTIIRPDWVQRCDRLPARRSNSYVLQSWDTALGSSQRHDFSVCLTLLVQDNYYFVLDVLRDRCEPAQLLEYARSRAEIYQPNHIVIEDCFGMGSALLSHLQGTRHVVTAVKPEGDKRTRLLLQSLKIKDRRLVIPNGPRWVSDFLDEIFSFPNVNHDDQIDALSQALAYADQRVNAFLWTAESLKGLANLNAALSFPFW
jgi:predicted phage terminase large subunit-like protein